MIEKKNVYREYLLTFLQEIAIVCPSCKQQAFVLTPDYVFGHDIHTQIKCFNCQHVKEKSVRHNLYFFNGRLKSKMGEDTQIMGLPIDPFFHQPLWYQTPYQQYIFWAYNREHLKDMERTIEGIIERFYGTKRSRRSHFIKLLPKWLRENASDRFAVLSIIKNWLR